VKPAWHAVRRALAPLACALRRDTTGLSAWVMNAGPSALVLAARWRLWALDGRLLHDEVSAVTAVANGSNTIAVPAALAGSDEALVVSLQLQAADGQGAAATAWPEPYRWYRFPDPRIICQVEGATTLVLSAVAPAKGVWLQAPGARFADNFVDLLPGEPVSVPFEGSLDGLSINCLNTLQDPPEQAARP
jgi:beta-mannosidase